MLTEARKIRQKNTILREGALDAFVEGYRQFEQTYRVGVIVLCTRGEAWAKDH